TNVKLLIFNLLGQKIAELVNANLSAGKYDVNFDGSSFSSGQYIYQLITDQKVLTRKMILIK
ncbi:MAG: T9SS type A sorting domain-containing protein, partial [Candidatus Marinimicrobia bacterium]|nr:T9SS type A sorting domain-containing protein [Candidatus Neomarinimicrobiota bacterium]